MFSLRNRLLVSCPGVWLCQDGRVSLTVFALGTSYQTCLLPPMFPLMFKDVLYFRKRFQETCALNNICCLLKDETIFCELVQWCEDCNSGECTILAQYLGALNDVLFPPNMCSNDGVDLLMRRSKDFPGILSPKIEIATKVRIDEVWNTGGHISQVKTASCHCSAEADLSRQRQVCHTPLYHRNRDQRNYQSLNTSVQPTKNASTELRVKCNNSGAGGKRPRSRSRSRSRSGGSRSCVSLREPDLPYSCKWPHPVPPSRGRRSPPRRPHSACRPRACSTYVYSATTEPTWNGARKQATQDDGDDTPPPSPSTSSPHSSPRSRRPRSASRSHQYKVYSVESGAAPAWAKGRTSRAEGMDGMRSPTRNQESSNEGRQDCQKIQLESRYIEDDNERIFSKQTHKIKPKSKLKPCVCEICKRYHELFHSEYSNT